MRAEGSTPTGAVLVSGSDSRETSAARNASGSVSPGRPRWLAPIWPTNPSCNDDDPVDAPRDQCRLQLDERRTVGVV